MIVFEFGGPIQWKPGYYKSTIGAATDAGPRDFLRIWWLFIAITLVRCDLKEFGDILKTNTTEWRNA